MFTCLRSGMSSVSVQESDMRYLSIHLILVVVFLVLLMLFDERRASFVLVRPCSANSDCTDDECCLQKPWTRRFFCSKRVRKGKVCWAKQHNATTNWDKYRIICPCIHKHECVFKEPIIVLKPVLAAATCQPKMDDMGMMM